MITNEDIKKKTEYVVSTADLASSFLLFLKKEEIMSFVLKLEDAKKVLTLELIKKNKEFEDVSVRCVRNIRDNYIPKLSAFWETEKEEGIESVSVFVNSLSDTVLEKAKSIIGVNDNGMTINNLSDKIQLFNIKTPFMSQIQNVQSSMLEFKKLSVLHEDTTKTSLSEMKSLFDSFCIRGQNIVFVKYLEVFDLAEKIRNIIKQQDALCIASYIITKKRLFTDYSIRTFLEKDARSAVLLAIKDVSEIGRA